MLRCENLSLVYPDGESTKTVLNNVNFNINKGENVILLGPSGSGKSSLIYLLSCLRKPTSGSVFLGDINLSAQKNDQMADIRKQKLSFIFQMHFLLPYLTAIENVLVGKNDFSKASKEDAADLLDKLGLGAHTHKKIHQLSGGERQRVAIARALINNPEIIFADEPTASLDHDTAMGVIHILKSHRPDCTLVMATHDTTILSGDERQILIANGNISEKE